MIRRKQTEADLKRTYRKTLSSGIGLSVLLHLLLFAIIPAIEFEVAPRTREPVVIELEKIPETRQSTHPLHPLYHLSSEVVVDTLPRQRPIPPPEVVTAFSLEEEEEVVEFWMLEKKPRVLKRVLPEYPARARQGLVEGKVVVRILVDQEGRVERVDRITGPQILRAAAGEASWQWRFTPAIQNDQAVKVWVSLPFAFRLEDPALQESQATRR